MMNYVTRILVPMFFTIFVYTKDSFFDIGAKVCNTILKISGLPPIQYESGVDRFNLDQYLRGYNGPPFLSSNQDMDILEGDRLTLIRLLPHERSDHNVGFMSSCVTVKFTIGKVSTFLNLLLPLFFLSIDSYSFSYSPNNWLPLSYDVIVEVSQSLVLYCDTGSSQ